MSSHKIFDITIEKNGYNYYIVPKGYPLFKASKEFNNTNNISLNLEPDRPYFFGLKNEDPNYIYNYEEEYGIIFEYITKEPIELLALDDKKTIDKLYKEAPSEIKTILEKNYGLKTKTRLSESGPDRIFSNYLCTSTNLGQQCLGYAIYEMDTDFGGKFHPELLICNASKYVQYVRQVTINPVRIKEIIESGKLKNITNKLQQSRREARKRNININNININNSTNKLFNDYDIKPVRNLFGDDNTPELNGGIKIRILKKTLKRDKKKRNKKRKHIKKKTYKNYKTKN